MSKKKRHGSPPSAQPAQAYRAAVEMGASKRLFLNDKAVGIAIFLFALSLRAIYLIQIRSTPFFSSPILDGLYYDTWARSIAAGDWLGRGPTYGNPLYAYLLGAIYFLFGRDLFLVRSLQHVIGASTCVLLFVIGKKLFSRSAGIVAGLMASLYGIFIFFEGEIGLDSVAVFLAVASIYMLIRAGEIHSARSFFAAGVVCGLFMLARANILPLAAGIWVMVLMNSRALSERLKSYGWFILAIMLVISPVTIKNYATQRELVFITAHGGETFYVGNNPESDGTCKQPDFVMPNTMEEHEDFRKMASKQLGHTVSLAGSSRYWASQAFKFIREHPGAYMRLLARKAALFCKATEISDNQQYYFFKEYSPILRIPFWSFGFLFPASLIGMGLCLSDRRRLGLLYLFTILYSVSITLYFITSRYRAIVIPFLMLFAAYAVVWFAGKVARKESAPIFGTAALFIALVFVSYGGIPEDLGIDTGYYNLAKTYEDKGLSDKAIESYRKAIELNPGHFRAYANLGNLYHEKGMLDDALIQYEQALKLNPQDHKTLNNLAILYERKGSFDAALEYYLKAVEVKPDYAVGYSNMGQYYMRRGDGRSAAACMEKSVALMPDNFQYRNDLGAAYFSVGDKARALECWRESLEINTDQPKLADMVRGSS